MAYSSHTSQSWQMSAGSDYRPNFTCSRLLDFLEHCKHTGRCVNAVRLSANGVRAFPKDQQTLHTHTYYRDCSGNICKRNIFCGYASYIKIFSIELLPYCTR
jgi:hypothetical protein